MDPIINQNDSGRQAEQVPGGRLDQHKGLSIEAQDMLQQEWAFQQQIKQMEKPAAPSVVSLTGDAIYSAVYTGAQGPVIGLCQLVSKDLAKNVEIIPPPNPAEFGTAKWHAQVIGDGAGMLVPFLATRQGMKNAGLSLVAKEQAAVTAGRLARVSNSAMIADSALTGFACDFLTRPVDMQKGNIWDRGVARTKNGVTGALTFGIMGATSTGLRATSREMAMGLTGTKKIAYNATIGAASGIPAGIVNADASAILNEGRLATGKERLVGAYGMAVAGGVLGSFHPTGDKTKTTLSSKDTATPIGAFELSRGHREAVLQALGDMQPHENIRDVVARATQSLPKESLRHDSRTDKPLLNRVKSALQGDQSSPKGDVEGRQGADHNNPVKDSQTATIAEAPGSAALKSAVESTVKPDVTPPARDVSDRASETGKSAEQLVKERPEAAEQPRAIDPKETVSMRELVERNDPRVDELMKEYYPKLEKAFPLEGEIETTDTYKEYLSDPKGTWDMVLLRDAEQKIIGGIQFQVVDAKGEMLQKVAWVEHIWVEEGNRTHPNFKSLLKIAEQRTKEAGADLVFMEFNNPDKMTLEQMAEDAEGGITTQDRETLWGSVGIHVAVDSKGNIAEYGQPSMDGQPSVEYLSLGFIGGESLTGKKLPISDYLALSRAAHSTIPGVDLATDPTVLNYTKACAACEGKTFTLKPLADIAKVRRAEAKLKAQNKSSE